jgi:hypothetical protein
VLRCERLARQWHARGQGFESLGATVTSRRLRRAIWVRDHELYGWSKSMPRVAGIAVWRVRDTTVLTVLRCGGRTWLGVGAVSSPNRFGPMPRSGARPMLQAAKRAGAAASAGAPSDPRPWKSGPGCRANELRRTERLYRGRQTTFLPRPRFATPYRLAGAPATVAYSSGRLRGMASPENGLTEGRGRRQSRRGSPDSRGAGAEVAVANRVDALLMVFVWVATSASRSASRS